MADFESTYEWKVDITQFNKAMQEAKAALTRTNREFDLTVSTMDRWSASASGLEAKIRQLNGQVEVSSHKIEIYKNAWEEAKEEFGESSGEAERLRNLIEKEQISINKANVQIERYTNSLNQMNAEQQKSSSKYEELNNKINEQQLRVNDLKQAYASAVLQYGKTSTQAQELARALQQASNELAENKQKMNAAEKAADSLDESIEEVGNAATVSANGGFTVLKGALANLVSQGINRVIDGFKNLAKSAISYESEIEQYKISFEVMTGSAEKAGEMVSKLSDIVKKTPFDMPTLADTVQLLMNYGITADEAIDKMMQLGDISQGSSDKLGRIALAYGQMSSAGKVHLQDIKQMIEAGFNPLQEISERTGESMESLYKRISKGTISVDEIKVAFENATAVGGKYYNSMNKQSQSLQGRMEALREQVNTTLGQTFQPLLQKLSDRLLPRVSKLLESIDTTKLARGLSDFGDKIIVAFDWIVENGDTVLEVLKQIALAFVTYKAVSIIGDVVSSFTTLVKAIKAGETAMRALNMAFGATPVGMVALAVAGLVTGVTLLTKHINESIHAQYGLNDEQQQAIDKVTELTARYNDLNTARQEQVSDINAEYSYIEQLKDNYNSLIDSNGKVKKGYEDRAQFILNQLAQAMGVEVEDIQKLIDKNGELGEAIDKVIQKKQAEAILAANEQMYNQAIKERGTALTELTNAQNALEEAEKKYTDTKSQANDIWEKYNELMKYAPDAAAEYLEANGQILLANDEARRSYEEAKTAVENAENAWIGYNSTIQNYEGLAEAIISGDTEKINAAMQNMMNNFITAETGNRESLERQVTNYKSNLDALEKAIENGTPSVTQEMVEQAKSMVEAAEKELDKLPPEAEKKGKEASTDFADGVGFNTVGAKKAGESVANEGKAGLESVKADKSGENFGQGFINGLASMASKAWTAGWNFVKKAWAGLKAGQEEGSPSRLTRRSGEFFGEGFALGIQDMMKPVANVASDMANGAVDAMADALGINSPSKVAQDKIGKNLVLGIIQGVKAEKKNAKKSASELANLYISAAKTRVSDLKKANKMSLAEEVDFWNQMSNQVKKHSAAYNAALAQMETAKKSLNSAAEKLTKTYVSDVSKINQELEKNIASLEDSYINYANQRADQLKSAFGLFDAVRMDTKKSKDALKENLQNQVQALKEYDTTLAALEKRLGSNSDIVAELRKMGVSSVETMKSLNSMSDAELKEYAKLYEERNKLAEKRADAESATLKKSIEKQISQLKASAKKQINALTATYEEELAELQGSVGSSGKQIGKAISDGINSGMTAGMKNLTDSLKKQVKNLVNSVKKQLKIKSPSRVFADEIGKMMPLGIAEGFKNAMPDAENTMQASIMKAVNDLKGDMSNINWQMGGQFGGGAAASVGETINEQNITFNQYNNSPKALDRLSVYRDTNNLLFSAKVRLNNV